MKSILSIYEKEIYTDINVPHINKNVKNTKKIICVTFSDIMIVILKVNMICTHLQIRVSHIENMRSILESIRNIISSYVIDNSNIMSVIMTENESHTLKSMKSDALPKPIKSLPSRFGYVHVTAIVTIFTRQFMYAS